MHIRLLNIAITLLLAIPSLAHTYPKVLLAGDYPDPTVLRDGDDYYMTHSPFYYLPGFLIWHSRDLVNWQPIGRAVPEYSGSAMAPDLVKFGDRYYIYFPSAGTNWVTYADNINGPWSKPIDLKIDGIDPGHVADAEGNRYLFVNNGYYVKLSPDGLSVTSGKNKVYDGWEYPRNWITEGMYLESPKLTYHNGYYYLTSAEGGTAGPATSHMAVMARSKSPVGPWENSPYNPTVHTYNDKDNWWSKGHGTIIDDKNGNWWIIYHAYANGYHTLGRSTLIEPLEYTTDGWFKPKYHDVEELPADTATTHGMQLSDDFTSSSLGNQWMFWKENAAHRLDFTGKGLKMTCKGYGVADSRLLMVTPQHKCYTAGTHINLSGKAKGGLLLFYNEEAYAGLLADKNKLYVHTDANHVKELPNDIGTELHVRITNRGNNAQFLVSADGKDWHTVEENIDVSSMHHNNHGGFYALRIALAGSGKGNVTFKDFKYRDAVPSEEDMSAYLMVFHRDETHSLHMAISHDGYNFTALNNGQPVISGDTIAEQKGIRDPHIYRGPDGAFYLAMTDLHIYAKEKGFRDTQWERPGEEYDWGNNRGLVLMKSFDLINWTRANIRFDKLSAGLADIGCAWAPETIYDETQGKMMVYFTMRFKNERNKLYYVYVNDDFNKIESLPRPLFDYPVDNVSAIDGDITKTGDKYHLFYVAHEGKSGIKHAVSDRINGGYQYFHQFVDFEPKACEAPTVWKRIGENKWVLMYDIFSITPHNFGFAETSDFLTFKNLGHFNSGVMKSNNFSAPKHGAVIHLTAEETARLERHWSEKSVSR